MCSHTRDTSRPKAVHARSTASVSAGPPKPCPCRSGTRPKETISISPSGSARSVSSPAGTPVDIDEPMPHCRCRPIAGPTLSRPQMRVADFVKDPHDHRVVLINCAKMHPWTWVRSHQLIMRVHLQRQPRLVDATHGRSLAGQHRSRVQVPPADPLTLLPPSPLAERLASVWRAIKRFCHRGGAARAR